MALVRNATILFACSMAGNAANYCFQFVMGRSLSLEDYGAMNALLSVATFITLPTSAVMMVIAKYASTYTVKNVEAELGSLYRMSLRKIAIAAVLITAVFLLLIGFIGDYLRIDSLSTVALLSIGIFGSYVMTVNLGMLQGMQRFYYLGAGIGLGGVLRFILAVLFMLLGFKLNGALLATVLPTLIIFGITLPPLSNYMGKGEKTSHDNILKYSVPVLLSSLAYAFLTNIDLIMVKHFLEAREAGLYASVAVLGKTLMYLPSSFALAVFPMVSEADLLNGDSFKILDKAVLSTLALCGFGVAAFALYPEFIVSLLFGSRFAEAAPYLKYYGAAMAMMSVLSILISFNLARGKTSFVYSLAIGCAFTAVAIEFFHEGIMEIVVSITTVFFILTAYNLICAYRQRHAYYRLKETDGFRSAVFSADRDEA